MTVDEIVEGVVPAFGRSGNKTVRKYRCTTGSRKGRVVAKASTCSAPKNVKASVTLKKTKAAKGANIKAKTRRTKTANPSSIRSRKANVSINKKSRRGSRRRSRI